MCLTRDPKVHSHAEMGMEFRKDTQISPHCHETFQIWKISEFNFSDDGHNNKKTFQAVEMKVNKGRIENCCFLLDGTTEKLFELQSSIIGKNLDQNTP